MSRARTIPASGTFLAGFLASGILALTSPGIGLGQPAATKALEVPVVDDEGVTVENTGLDLVERVSAAQRILRSDDPAARARLLSWLDARTGAAGAVGHEPGAQMVTLRAIADLSSAPAWLAGPLVQLLRDPSARDSSAECRGAAIAALSSVRTREAARGLLTYAGDKNTPGSLATAALRALGRLCGNESLGTDLRDWSMWYTQVEWLTEAEWRRVLADGLAARADAAARDRDLATQRLGEGVRRDFQAATGDERSRVLERALRDDIGAVRRTGFTLALQELANARGLDSRVARAALDLLASTDSVTRRSAAELLNVIAPAEFAPELGRALSRESDAGTAALLLRSAARWPDPQFRPVVLRWLEYGEPTRSPAIDALDAMHQRGWIEDSLDRARVLSALRISGAPDAGAGIVGQRLLFALGDENDRTRVIEGLKALEPEQRSVLGDALAQEPGAVDMLLAAARTDPALFSAAAKALAKHRPTAASYQLLTSFNAQSLETLRDAQAGLAARLEPEQLVGVAKDTPDDAQRERVLARLASEPTRLGASGGPDPAIIEGLLLLARTRLTLNQPSACVQALDAMPALLGEGQTRQRDDIRTVALLSLGRIEEATSLGAGIEQWTEGLGRSMGQPHAGAVMQAIDDRFGMTIPPDVGARLAGLREQLGSFVGPRRSR